MSQIDKNSQDEVDDQDNDQVSNLGGKTTKGQKKRNEDDDDDEMEGNQPNHENDPSYLQY